MSPRNFAISDATALGSVHLVNGPISFVTYRGVPEEMKGTFFAEGAEDGLRERCGGKENCDQFLIGMRSRPTATNRERCELFANVEDLAPPLQFLLSCGPLGDLKRAQSSLPDDVPLRVLGAGLTPLEWAARRGHFDIAEWLATDPRTSHLLTLGAPIAWACYGNHVDIAKILCDNGADSTATNDAAYDMPPLHLAAENGSLAAVKWLVNDQGHDIFQRHPKTQHNIRSSIRRLVAFDSCPDLSAVDAFADDLGVPLL